MTKKEPREPNNSDKAKAARLAQMHRKLGHIAKSYDGKDDNIDDRPLNFQDASTQAQMLALQEELFELGTKVALLSAQYDASLEKLEEEISDRELKKNQDVFVRNFLQKVYSRRNKKNYKFTQKDLEEFLECFDCLCGSIKWVEEKATYINKFFEESGKYSELLRDRQRLRAVLNEMEETVKGNEEKEEQLSDWDISLINKRLSALEEENFQLSSEIDLLNQRAKESSAIQGLMVRWFFLLSQDQKFNYADLLKVLSDPEICDPKEEEPLNASFCRTQEAEQVYRESLRISKITEQKKYVLAQIWEMVAVHNQKCEIYDDLSPICPWVPVIKVIANRYFVDIGQTILRRSPAEHKEQSFLAAYYFYRKYNPQEFYLSQEDSRKLIEEWKFSYTKKIGLKPSVEKKANSTFSSTDFCSKRLAESERDEIVKSSVEGITQVFGTSCKVRLKDEILGEITDGKL